MTRPSHNIDRQLIAAAKKLIPETGFAGLTVRDVAAAAGVNPGMFTYHFRTRECFIEQLLKEVYEEFFCAFVIESAEGADSREKLRNALIAVGRFVRENRQLLTAFLQEIIHGDRMITDFARKNMTGHIAVIRKLIRACQKEGTLVRMSEFQILLILLPAVVGANIAARVLEINAGKNIVMKGLAAGVSAATLSDRALRQRVDLLLRGMAPEAAS